jgi:hypothetical protein
VNLSLKDNAIEDVDKLRGLSFFGFNFMTQDENIKKSATEIGLFASPFRLKKIHLEENPVSESGAGRRAVAEYLGSNIPTLAYIDGAPVRASSVTAVAPSSSAAAGGGGIQLNKVLQRKERSDDDDQLDSYRNKGLDNQEKEFLAALKGEKDNSVVS